MAVVPGEETSRRFGPDTSASGVGTEVPCLPRHEAGVPVSEKEDGPAFDEVMEETGLRSASCLPEPAGRKLRLRSPPQ